MPDTNPFTIEDFPFKVAVVMGSNNIVEVVLEVQIGEPSYYVMTKDQASMLGSELVAASGAVTMADHMKPHLTDEQIDTMFGDRW